MAAPASTGHQGGTRHAERSVELREPQAPHDQKESEESAHWRTLLLEDRIESPEAFVDFALQRVSRTFALNIQILPTTLRRKVLLAYLFCRMADTIEDDPDLPPAEKIVLLETFRDIFPMTQDWPERLAGFVNALPTSWREAEQWDKLLTWHSRYAFALFSETPSPSASAVSEWVREMCRGMAGFTERFAQSRSTGGMQSAINTMDDLDEYCYYVAGTVGNMLCDLFALHSPLISPKLAAALREYSVSFGLGLQLTNILKDIADDSNRDVSFIPEALLKTHGLTQSEFLNPERSSHSLEVMSALIQKARTHLQDAMAYTKLLPRLEPRLRLFCLWPLFMATETLVALAERDRVAGVREKVKISRGQVQAIIRNTSLTYWSNHLLDRQFQGMLSRLDSGLAARSGSASR